MPLTALTGALVGRAAADRRPDWPGRSTGYCPHGDDERVNRKAVVYAALLVVAAGAGCGAQRGAGRSRTLNWYVFNEPGGAYDAAVTRCNRQARGRYRIHYVPLPTDANQQREL